jgi:hypothetical protein
MHNCSKCDSYVCIVLIDLPFGWEKCVSEDGKVFYVDHANRRTTYSDPRLAFATEEKEHAQDFRQRFDGSTMALQVLHGRDLAGKVAVITGANAGIGMLHAGLQTCIHLGSQGFWVLSNRVKHFRNWICFCSLMKQLRGT